MMLPPEQWLLAALFAAVIVGIAYILNALSPSGGVAAFLLGTTIVGTGGWWPGVILVVFFTTSSLLSQSTRSTNQQARGPRRDWIQVIANGWSMLLGGILFATTGWQAWLVFGIGGIAAATADTWSSEIGRTSPTVPRLITTLRSAAPGTSGAISARGTMASLAGSVFIAIITATAIRNDFLPLDSSIAVIFTGISLAGFAGGIIDSLLGATVQEQRWCETCAKATEANPHNCGTPTHHIGGIRGLNNDVVNMLCVLTGALIGLLSSIL